MKGHFLRDVAEGTTICHLDVYISKFYIYKAFDLEIFGNLTETVKTDIRPIVKLQLKDPLKIKFISFKKEAKKSQLQEIVRKFAHVVI